ncbi:hypothetical protein BT96DRAFT_239236 [Gymnopus androsaceus JB14]|uniref:Uncharacterized protein n=1 Tax=Gymnopus androsaceus JB14 TaxID=1447944 RepID=A0A6A4ILR6_9AGAR|nr:hypothetical protein BT96DRAFT_239236 [Gymnopus androsaceus JB14]
MAPAHVPADIGQRLKVAAVSFCDGLLEYMQRGDNYKQFIVPFGKTYIGLKINQVRDKGWFEWSVSKPALENLRNKYTIYFTAVRLWLDNPRKEEQIRDIGESLASTEYADDLDLYQDDDDYSDTESESDDSDSAIEHDTDSDESEDWQEEDGSRSKSGEDSGASPDVDSDESLDDIRILKTKHRLSNSSNVSFQDTPTKKRRTSLNGADVE